MKNEEKSFFWCERMSVRARFYRGPKFRQSASIPRNLVGECLPQTQQKQIDADQFLLAKQDIFAFFCDSLQFIRKATDAEQNIVYLPIITVP